jgi:hypothetical protein
MTTYHACKVNWTDGTEPLGSYDCVMAIHRIQSKRETVVIQMIPFLDLRNNEILRKELNVINLN